MPVLRCAMMWLVLGCGLWRPPPSWQEPARLLQDHARASAEADPGGVRLTVQSGHGARPLSVAASADGAFVATADDTGLVVIWDAWRGRQLRVLAGPGAAVAELVWWSPPGQPAAVVVRDARGRSSAWSAETGLALEIGLPRASSLAVSPDGSTLAVGSRSGEIVLLDGSGRRVFRAPSGAVRVAFADDDLLVAADRSALRAWSLPDGGAQAWPLASAPTALAAGGGWAVTGDSSRGVCGWSLDIAQPRWCVPADGELEGLAVLSGSRVVARRAGAAPWERWLRTGEPPPSPALPAGLTHPIADVAPLGAAAVVTDAAGQVWSTAPIGPAVFGGRAHPGAATALGGERLLVSGGGHHSVWDRAAGRLALHVETEDAPATLSADGAWLVVGAPGRLERHDLGRSCREEQALTVTPTAIAASADGGRVLIGSASGVMLLASGSDVPLWAAPLPDAPMVALSADGQQAAAVTARGRLLLWDGARARMVTLPRAAVAGVTFWGGAALVFGAQGSAGAAWRVEMDGTIFEAWTALPSPLLGAAAASADAAIATTADGRRCDLPGTCSRPPAALSVPLRGLSATADGAWLAGGRLDGGALLWPVDAPDSAMHLVTFDDERARQAPPRCEASLSSSPSPSLPLAPWAVLQPLRQRYDTDGLTREAALHWTVDGTMAAAPLAAMPADRYQPELLREGARGAAPQEAEAVVPPPRVWLPAWPRLAAGDAAVEVCADAAVSLRVQLNGRDLHPAPALGEQGCATVALRGEGLRRDENTLAISTGAPALESLPLVYRLDGRTAVSLASAPLVGLPGGGGLPRRQLARPADAPTQPGLYVLAVGISGYDAEALRLTYADADAEALVALLRRGAEGDEPLFGTVEIVTLTDDEEADGDAVSPEEILRAARDLSGRMGSPDDIFGLFFAGHGVVREADGDWYFLTSGAPAASLSGALTDAEADAHGVSTAQLAAVLRDARALRQVLVLDTCASGIAADALADQRTALAGLTDRAGLLVLAASDKAAYESSGEAHGLLTYGLMRALTNEQLVRNYDNYWFVGPMFDYAAWEVARKTGGAQHPIVLRPSRARFHVGRWSSELRLGEDALGPTVLIHAEALGDPLGLSAAIDATLRDGDRLSGRGAAPHVEGHYTTRGQQVIITAGLVEEGVVRAQTTVRAASAEEAASALLGWAEVALEAGDGR